jgi:hypothetical protein
MPSTVRPAVAWLKGHFGALGLVHYGQQLQVTDAFPPGENDTEPLPPPRQMPSFRVAVT